MRMILCVLVGDWETTGDIIRFFQLGRVAIFADVLYQRVWLEFVNPVVEFLTPEDTGIYGAERNGHAIQPHTGNRTIALSMGF